MCKMPLGLWAGELPVVPSLITHSAAPHQKRENPVLRAPLILKNGGGGGGVEVPLFPLSFGKSLPFRTV